ncbi:MAG: HEAT repeat domain-containing protein [Candidatus Thorarchaeota archaeon]
MSEKDDRALSSALGGGESVGRLRKAVKKTTKKPDHIIEKMLSNLTSIQACKDAAMTGDDDLRVLAVLRLGEYGADAFEALDIAMHDDNPSVRSVAAGMLANSEDKDAVEILTPFQSDNNESVRGAVEFSLSWLDGRATFKEHGTPIPQNWENPIKMLLETEAIPLRTSDHIQVFSTYTADPGSLEFGVSVENPMDEPINEVSVKILLYPYESLEPADSLTQMIETIEPGGNDVLIFGFNVTNECVEGEFVTSVQFIDLKGEDIAAKSGNIFVRSIFEQFKPLEATPEELRTLKSELKEWNREHSLATDAKGLFDTLIDLFEYWNIHVVQSESTEKESMFMGVLSGMAQGRITEKKLVVTLTIVGKIDDDLSKLRIDVLSDDSEILQSVASVVFETIQRKLGVIDID